MELICLNGNRDSGTKFTSPEFCLPFSQTVDRPFARVNSKQPLFWLLDLLLFCSSSLPSLSPSPAGPVSEISPLPKSFVRCSMRSYEGAGWLDSRDLVFSNRDLGRRARNFSISRTLSLLSISYRDESRMNSGGPDGIVLHCLLYFPHHKHPI